VNIVLQPSHTSRPPRRQLPSCSKKSANFSQPVYFLRFAHSLHTPSRSNPLFSIACTLFHKNTRVGVIQFLTRHRHSLQISPLCFHTLTNLLAPQLLYSQHYGISPISFNAPFVFPRTRLRPVRHCRSQPRRLATFMCPGQRPSAINRLRRHAVSQPFPNPAARRLLLSFSQPFARPAGPCRANGRKLFFFQERSWLTVQNI
jgi:hypothetical protein